MLSIPLIAGIVGYLTNVLAVRMLFRPFAPHWYTLGWQGIIPRTRNALASNVAKVVGGKLVTAEEIEKALSQKHLKDELRGIIMQAAVCRENQTKAAEKAKIFSDAVLLPALDRLFAEPNVITLIEKVLSGIIREIRIKINGMKREEAADWLKPLSCLDNSALRGKLVFMAEKAAFEHINNFIYSGKSINDIVGVKANSGQIVCVLMPLINSAVKELFAGETFAQSAGKLIVDYKNRQFGDSFIERLKLGAANAFLSDDKIYEMTREKLPEIGVNITEDKKMQDSMCLAVARKVDSFFTLPIGNVTGIIGEDTYYTLLHKIAAYIAGVAVPEDLGARVLGFIRGNGDDQRQTLGGFFYAGENIMFPADMDIIGKLNAGATAIKLKEWIDKAVKSEFPLSEKETYVAADILAGLTLRIFHIIIPKCLSMINITSLAEQKINSLELKEVEDMLLSFMKNHFKWINILGFAVGFVIGCAQVLFISGI